MCYRPRRWLLAVFIQLIKSGVRVRLRYDGRNPHCCYLGELTTHCFASVSLDHSVGRILWGRRMSNDQAEGPYIADLEHAQMKAWTPRPNQSI